MIKFHIMRRLYNSFSGIHTLALVMIITLFLFFPLFDDKDLKKDSVTPTASYIEGLRIIHRKKEDTAWTIMARRANFSRDEKIAMLDSIIIDIQKDNITLSAEKGVFDLETRDLRLEKNIVLKSKGYEVALKDLSWNPSKGLLKSDKQIELKGKGFNIKGDGLSATEEQKLKLHRNVRAIFF